MQAVTTKILHYFVYKTRYMPYFVEVLRWVISSIRLGVVKMYSMINDIMYSMLSKHSSEPNLFLDFVIGVDHLCREMAYWNTTTTVSPSSTQPGRPSVGRHNEYQQKLGHKGTPKNSWSCGVNWCLAEG